MKYVTARRITCSEDKEATTYMVRACDKNGRRRITVESIMALCCRIKGKRSECCASRKMLQSKIKAYSKQCNLQESELRGVDSCQHNHLTIKKKKIRGIQSVTEILPLKKRRGVAHTFNHRDTNKIPREQSGRLQCTRECHQNYRPRKWRTLRKMRNTPHHSTSLYNAHSK